MKNKLVKIGIFHRRKRPQALLLNSNQIWVLGSQLCFFDLGTLTELKVKVTSCKFVVTQRLFSVQLGVSFF